MPEVRDKQLGDYVVRDKEGKIISDLIAFDLEEGWYQVNKRGVNKQLEKKGGEQVRSKVYDEFSAELKNGKEEVKEKETEEKEKETEEIKT